MKESKQITLSPSNSTTVPTDFKYRMRGKVITITYLGAGPIHKELGRILRKIEHWHMGSIQSFRILYQDADGLGGEIKWDGAQWATNLAVGWAPIHSSSEPATHTISGCFGLFRDC
jgi:hypothetical protein